MKKGRSVYTFQFNCDPNLVDNVVQGYIQGNQYELQQKDGEQFYRAGDAMVQGYRYFNYLISGQTLTIYAWFRGVLGEMQIEQNSLNMAAMAYRNSLNLLFQEISKLNNEVLNINNNMNLTQNVEQSLNQNIYQQSNQNNVNQFTQTFQNETTEKQENMCEVGFWLSLFGLLCSFMGVTYGVIIYILNFYFASQGLKTRKRGKAVVIIMLSIISILVIISQIIGA